MANIFDELTERQIKILKTVVDEYIANGNPIGSEFLEKKFKLGYSPATIRNEMVVLGKHGYIEKSHFSAGRIPTPKAFRLYINSLLPKKQLSTAEEVSLKNAVWDYQDDMVRFLEETAAALAKRTRLLSLVMLNSGFRYYTGVDNLLALKEFFDIEFSRNVFSYIDNVQYWTRVFEELFDTDLELQVFLGEDYLYKPLYSLGGVFCHFDYEDTNGVIGILGPCRLEYSTAMPLVNYTGDIIRQVLKKHYAKKK